MTDHDLPAADDRDLLACAYLDGEATPDERAAVEADPELRTRVEQLRSVRAQVAAPPPPPAGAAGDAVARALDAVGGDVVDLDRRRRRRRSAWLGPAAVAAVVLLVLVALPLVLLARNDDADTGDQAASGRAPSTLAQGQEGSGGGAASSGADAAGPTSDDATMRDLGSVNGDVDLERRLAPLLGPAPSTSRSQDSAAPSSTTASGGFRLEEKAQADLTACDAAVRGREANLGTRTYAATLVFDGTPAVLLAYDAASDAGDTVVVVVARNGCGELTRLRL
jgi:hypothetical protein